jgi:hypothetical protein
MKAAGTVLIGFVCLNAVAAAAQPAATQPPSPSTEQVQQAPAQQSKDGSGAGKADANSASNPAAAPAAAAVAPSVKPKPSEQERKPNEEGQSSIYSWLASFLADVKVTDVVIAIFAGAQVWFARRQANIYQRQSVIMDQQRQIMDRQTDLSIATQRAFVAIKEMNGFISIDGNFGPLDGIVHIRLVNSGNTPAKRVAVWVNSACVEGDLPEDFDFPPPDNPRQESGQIAPGVSVNLGYLVFQLADIRKVIARTHSFFVWGRCEYSDAFANTERRFITWCIDVDVIRPAVFTAAIEKRHDPGFGEGGPVFGFRTYRRGNDAS